MKKIYNVKKFNDVVIYYNNVSIVIIGFETNIFMQHYEECMRYDNIFIKLKFLRGSKNKSFNAFVFFF